MDITLTDPTKIDMGVSKGGSPGELWVVLRGEPDQVVRMPGDAAKAVYQKFGEALAMLQLTNASGTIQSAVGARDGMVLLDLWEIMKPERCVGISLFPVRARALARLLDEAADFAERSRAHLRLVTKETP